MKRLSLTLIATMMVVAIALRASPQEAFARDHGEKLPPLAGTTHVERFSATEVLVFGHLDPRGHRTIAWFEYGPTRHYGHIAPEVAEEAWFGEGVDVEEEILDCLRPRTVYHYRIVAKNKFGTTYGRDRAFRTPAGHLSPDHELCDGRV